MFDTSGKAPAVIRLVARKAALLFATALLSGGVIDKGSFAAEPFVSSPPSIKDCGKKNIKYPPESESRAYPSDECGVFFISPPTTILTKTAALFANVVQAECDAVAGFQQQYAKLATAQQQLADKLIEHTIDAAQADEESAQLELAETLLNKATKDDWETFGATVALSITQDWNGSIVKFQDANPGFDIRALPTVGGVISFQEAITPAELQTFGLYKNKNRAPYIGYTITGLPLIAEDSPLLDDNKLPIFFPIARGDRANQKSVEFGGAVTGNITLNKMGYCRMLANKSDPASFLGPQIEFNMALKTFGTYEVHINVDYLLTIVNTIAKETGGTYYASAVADQFYRERSTNTVNVKLDKDLTNSLDEKQQEGFIQIILTDAANQFLTTIARRQPRSGRLKCRKWTMSINIRQSVSPAGFAVAAADF
ncbi:hypothetical protein EHI42_19735 [Rhizobium hidalgonense]|uniref:hypothetical protein n=1 Tax=Rhizobium hidalgonense TaxID=1538159 RepID=UPI000FEC270F|nr:hypothetical protein [Rhizobium hidalgonense]RWX13628.1 hypothetical protein EHI42_19735 [Rhizobium hidalgonense]